LSPARLPVPPLRLKKQLLTIDRFSSIANYVGMRKGGGIEELLVLVDFFTHNGGKDALQCLVKAGRINDAYRKGNGPVQFEYVIADYENDKDGYQAEYDLFGCRVAVGYAVFVKDVDVLH
jgi:hypothetical protein